MAEGQAFGADLRGASAGPRGGKGGFRGEAKSTPQECWDLGPQKGPFCVFFAQFLELGGIFWRLVRWFVTFVLEALLRTG